MQYLLYVNSPLVPEYTVSFLQILVVCLFFSNMLDVDVMSSSF